MKKNAIRLAAVGGALLVILQLLPVGAPRDNPPATATIAGPAEVVEVLRRSCFDCHSNDTRWPLYAYVAPMSWMVAADVAGARARMNFSDWEDLRAGHRRRFARKIVERVEAGEMPMPRYLLVHRGARVSESDLAILRRWRDAVDPPDGRP